MSLATVGLLLRRFWWAIPIVALAAALHFTRAATLKQERAAWTAEIDRAEKARLTAERDHALRLAAALGTYADRLAYATRLSSAPPIP